MIYLLDTDLPNNKNLTIALTKIFGIGITTSTQICKQLGFAANLKTKELTDSQKTRVIKFIENSSILINLDLKKTITFNNQRLLNIKSYRGIRKFRGLPVRGQRTHTNSKTSKKLNFKK